MSTKKKLLLGSAGAAAAGGAGLDVDDVFSTYLYEGNGTANVIENGINLGQSNSGGGARFEGADTNCVIVPPSSDFGFGTGDYTIEFFVYKFSDKNYTTYYDQRTSSQDATTASPFIYSDVSGVLYFYVNGSNRITGSGADIANGAWTHVALCRSSGSTKLFVNGTQIGSTYSDSNNYETPANNFSFGGSEEQSLYNVEGYMSNVRVVKGSALYTSNFTAPTSALTAVSGTVLLALQGDDPFTDNSSSSHALVNDNATASTFGPFDAAETGEGGLVWTKVRSNGFSHALIDTERGVNNFLKSNATNAQDTGHTDTITSFNSNGYSLGSDSSEWFWNRSGEEYASWTFRKAPKFFDVVTYTASSFNQVISHNLGTTPGMIIVKSTDDSYKWMVYHRSNGTGKYMVLNSTDAVATDSGDTSFTAVSDTSFTVGTDPALVNNGLTYVAYLFAHNDGDGDFGPDSDQDIIKCGSYTGNGSSTGPEIDLGFEPQWLLVKNATNSGNSWGLLDVMRGLPVGSNESYLFAQASWSEDNTVGNFIEPTSTGFRVANSGNFLNANGSTIIYMAIRRGPLAAPEDATKVFAPNFGDTNTAEGYLGYVADWALKANRNVGTYNFESFQRLTQTSLLTSATDAEVSLSDNRWDNMIGYRERSQSQDTEVIMYTFARAPNFLDVVAYTGTGSARTISHNLGVVPEMMWIKKRNASKSWRVYHAGTGAGKVLYLDLTSGQVTTSTPWNNTTPTSSVFTLGTDDGVNGSGNTYIAYLFATVAGVSKVGSYTGDGTTDGSKVIDCGFSAGARFVFTKRTDTTGSWYVHDTVRGVVASGNDPVLQLNNTAAENTFDDYIDPHSSGFSVKSSSLTNASGGSYIFYAIA